jgi:hypothetical protein
MLLQILLAVNSARQDELWDMDVDVPLRLRVGGVLPMMDEKECFASLRGGLMLKVTAAVSLSTVKNRARWKIARIGHLTS